MSRRKKPLPANQNEPGSGYLSVIVLASTKGGVGKTTLSAALAVQAASEGARVALIDCDPQESLASWWDRRHQPDNPKLFEGLDGGSREALELIVSEGWDYVIVDTPPAMLDKIQPAVAAADLVVIPVRPSALDVEAVRIIEEMCAELKKPCAFVLNQIVPDWQITQSAVAYLSTGRRVILKPHIQLRQAHAAAMTVGKAAAEVDRARAVRDESAALWEAVKAQLAKARTAR